ncbi:MAG: hypothetical protein ACRDFB_07165, partial [Rhabdochlamydiaceae bacterium]
MDKGDDDTITSDYYDFAGLDHVSSPFLIPDNKLIQSTNFMSTGNVGAKLTREPYSLFLDKVDSNSVRNIIYYIRNNTDGTESPMLIRVSGRNIYRSYIGLPPANENKFSNNHSSSIQGGTSGSENSQAVAQSFNSNGELITSILLNLNVYGTPTDNLVVSINNTSVSGSTIVTKSIASSSLVNGDNTFTFDVPGNVLVGNTYWIVVTRSGSRDTNNFYAVNIDYQTSHYPSGALFTENNGSWDGGDTTSSFYFSVNFVG